jgi:hypothetical protein
MLALYAILEVIIHVGVAYTNVLPHCSEQDLLDSELMDDMVQRFPPCGKSGVAKALRG